ncbi:MAG: hypothetical protein JWN44_6056 [Myxococcales bacterium]|nr:hypothetical protein [Myxococcales bacterium]
MSRDPFAFASVNARTVAAAETARAALVTRLGISDADRAVVEASPVWPLLTTYCIESPLNIDWYDAKISAWKSRQRAFLGACVLVTIAVLSIMVRRDHASDPAIAQIGAVVAALLACLRILAGASDVKAQLGGFWRARADLKEAFLSFEQSWRGRVVAGGKIAENFENALWQEITNARHAVRSERDTYFATFAAPTDMLSSATGGLDAVLGRAREASLARNTAAAARNQPVTDARRQLDTAHADRAAQQRLLEILAHRPAAMTEETWKRARDEAETAHARAEADVARYSDLLKAAAKASTLNPSS